MIIDNNTNFSRELARRRIALARLKEESEPDKDAETDSSPRMTIFKKTAINQSPSSPASSRSSRQQIFQVFYDEALVTSCELQRDDYLRRSSILL